MTLWRRLVPGTLALVLSATAPGCATKHDIRDLQDRLALMQARQDSLYRSLREQHRELLDSVAATADLLVRVRGDLGHELVSLGQQLVQVQALTGASQRRLQDLNAQLEQSRQPAVLPSDSTGAAPPPAGAAVAPTTPGAAPTAAQLYAMAETQLQNGAPGTARLAFQQLLHTFPQDSLAPQAQVGVAETYVKEDPARAIRELDRVVELYPNSPQAPAALLRAAELQQDGGNVTRAREYLQRVLARYPDSPEAAQARRRLERLPARRSQRSKGAAARKARR